MCTKIRIHILGCNIFKCFNIQICISLLLLFIFILFLSLPRRGHVYSRNIVAFNRIVTDRDFPPTVELITFRKNLYSMFSRKLYYIIKENLMHCTITVYFVYRIFLFSLYLSHAHSRAHTHNIICLYEICIFMQLNSIKSHPHDFV